MRLERRARREGAGRARLERRRGKPIGRRDEVRGSGTRREGFPAWAGRLRSEIDSRRGKYTIGKRNQPVDLSQQFQKKLGTCLGSAYLVSVSQAYLCIGSVETGAGELALPR